MTVRTRFAPSPTGFLHIGGVRTALFNWLFAKRHGGQFVLRVDDTDQERNVEAALQPILDGFKWLGMNWDEGPEVGGPLGPYYQSQRTELYQKAVEQLLASGHAYKDYSKTEELQIEREAAKAEGKSFVYSRTWMAENTDDEKKFEAEGRKAVVRLKMPREGELVLKDLIRGDVKFQWAQEQDHVIARADGSVLYNLATVVDDNAMEISHVIRAEEHLSNTPRQVFIFEALGYKLPEFAHIPFVSEPNSKNKLSKRKLDKYLKNRDFAKLMKRGERVAELMEMQTKPDTFNPVIVDFYEQIGFLPDAILNYLVLLGWSLDDKTEEFTREEMIEHFSLERVNKSAASFDPQKLSAFQARAMHKLPIKQRVAMCLPYLQSVGKVAEPPSCDTSPYLKQILEAAGDRIEIAADILEFLDFYTEDDKLDYDGKAIQKRIIKPEEAPALLRKFRDVLADFDEANFEPAKLEAFLKDWVEAEEIQIGQIIHALRVSLTGKPAGFGMFDIMAILGKERCLKRIDLVLGRVE